MANFVIDNDSGIPVWIQVRRRLIYLIVSGHYGAGEQLPTVRELAVQLDINYNTVNKVYQDLERDGFIITRRGRGTFVADLDDTMLLALDNKVELLADELVREGLDFGMTGEEIVRTVKARIAQHETLSGRQDSSPRDPHNSGGRQGDPHNSGGRQGDQRSPGSGKHNQLNQRDPDSEQPDVEVRRVG